MTPKPPRRSNREARESLREMAMAARQAAREGKEIELDPASELFFTFAGPLLLQARNDTEFQAAVSIAEFVWFSSHFDVASQVQLLNDFIEETGLPQEMLPWLLDVYAELAERKALLTGE